MASTRFSGPRGGGVAFGGDGQGSWGSCDASRDGSQVFGGHFETVKSNKPTTTGQTRGNVKINDMETIAGFGVKIETMMGFSERYLWLYQVCGTNRFG